MSEAKPVDFFAKLRKAQRRGAGVIDWLIFVGRQRGEPLALRRVAGRKSPQVRKQRGAGFNLRRRRIMK